MGNDYNGGRRGSYSSGGRQSYFWQDYMQPRSFTEQQNQGFGGTRRYSLQQRNFSDGSIIPRQSQGQQPPYSQQQQQHRDSYQRQQQYQQPPYQRATYQQQPAYQQQPFYQQQPTYQQQPSYQQQPTYQQQPAYQHPQYPQEQHAASTTTYQPVQTALPSPNIESRPASAPPPQLEEDDEDYHAASSVKNGGHHSRGPSSREQFARADQSSDASIEDELPNDQATSRRFRRRSEGHAPNRFRDEENEAHHHRRRRSLNFERRSFSGDDAHHSRRTTARDRDSYRFFDEQPHRRSSRYREYSPERETYRGYHQERFEDQEYSRRGSIGRKYHSRGSRGHDYSPLRSRDEGYYASRREEYFPQRSMDLEYDFPSERSRYRGYSSHASRDMEYLPERERYHEYEKHPQRGYEHERARDREDEYRLQKEKQKASSRGYSPPPPRWSSRSHDRYRSSSRTREHDNERRPSRRDRRSRDDEAERRGRSSSRRRHRSKSRDEKSDGQRSRDTSRVGFSDAQSDEKLTTTAVAAAPEQKAPEPDDKPEVSATVPHQAVRVVFDTTQLAHDSLYNLYHKFDAEGERKAVTFEDAVENENTSEEEEEREKEEAPGAVNTSAQTSRTEISKGGRQLFEDTKEAAEQKEPDNTSLVVTLSQPEKGVELEKISVSDIEGFLAEESRLSKMEGGKAETSARRQSYSKPRGQGVWINQTLQKHNMMSMNDHLDYRLRYGLSDPKPFDNMLLPSLQGDPSPIYATSSSAFDPGPLHLTGSSTSKTRDPNIIEKLQLLHSHLQSYTEFEALNPISTKQTSFSTHLREQAEIPSRSQRPLSQQLIKQELRRLSSELMGEDELMKMAFKRAQEQEGMKYAEADLQSSVVEDPSERGSTVEEVEHELIVHKEQSSGVGPSLQNMEHTLREVLVSSDHREEEVVYKDQGSYIGPSLHDIAIQQSATVTTLNGVSTAAPSATSVVPSYQRAPRTNSSLISSYNDLSPAVPREDTASNLFAVPSKEATTVAIPSKESTDVVSKDVAPLSGIKRSHSFIHLYMTDSKVIDHSIAMRRRSLSQSDARRLSTSSNGRADRSQDSSKLYFSPDPPSQRRRSKDLKLKTSKKLAKV